MSDVTSLDKKQWLSAEEKKFLQNKEISTVYDQIKSEGRSLVNEIMTNVHAENMNKVNDTFLSGIWLNVAKIEETISEDADIWNRYKTYNIAVDGKTLLRMSDKGIALAQALAEKCISGLQNIQVKAMLKQSSYFTAKKEIDGYMWPNTTLLLEKIAKTDLQNGTPVLTFDGTITPELILKMYASCHPDIVTQIVSPSVEWNKNQTPEQKMEKQATLLQDIKKFEDELRTPGKNTGNLFALSEFYNEYVQISTLEEIQKKRIELEQKRKSLKDQLDILSKDPKSFQYTTPEAKNRTLINAQINYTDAILNRIIEAENKRKAEIPPPVVEAEQPQPTAEKQKSGQEIRQEKFDALLNDPKIVLSRQNFKTWNDVIMSVIENNFSGQEKEMRARSRVPFITEFKNQAWTDIYPLFSIAKDGRVVLNKKATADEKRIFAEALTKYFNENRSTYPDTDYLLYNLTLIRDKDTWYDLPYQKDLQWNLSASKYPIIDVFVQQRSKDLWLTEDQKKLFITSGDVITFYNAQVQKYRENPEYQQQVDDQSTLANQLLDDVGIERAK